MSTAEQLLTAEEYFQLADKPEYSELVRGVIAPMTPPGLPHGLICGQAYFLLRLYVDQHDLGRVACNDSGVITQRDPDTVRGADVCFYSYEQLPRDAHLEGYAGVSPNIIFEIRSPHDRWSGILEKVAEYLGAGVEAVCVFLPESSSAHVFYPDRPGVILQGDEELTLPAPLDGFHEPVSAFFATA